MEISTYCDINTVKPFYYLKYINRNKIPLVYYRKLKNKSTENGKRKICLYTTQYTTQVHGLSS